MLENTYMTISELSKKTGVSESTIRYYLKEGLLPQPIRTGKTRALYSQHHLKYLIMIKKMQTEEKKSLNTIRKELNNDTLHVAIQNGVFSSMSQRDKIISASVELFSNNGFASTNIDKIVNSAKISKETFYNHFKNKEELFMECADKIFYDMYKHVWQAIREEKNINIRRMKRRGAFFESYPNWIIMMNLVRGLSVGNNLAFKEKFKSVLKNIITPLIREYDLLKSSELIKRDLDSNLVGYFLMGMSEYAASLMEDNRLYSSDDVNNNITRVIKEGL